MLQIDPFELDTDELSSLYKEHPEQRGAALAMALRHRMGGEPKQAIKVLRAAEKHGQGGFCIDYEYALSLEALGKVAEAEKRLQSALSPDRLIRKTFDVDWTEFAEDARADFSKESNVNFEDIEMVGDEIDLQYLEFRLKKQPANPYLNIAYGLVSARMRSLREAMPYLEIAINHPETAKSTLEHLAMCTFDTGEADQFMECAQTLLDIEPDNLTACMIMGTYASNMENDETALEWYERAHSKDPNNYIPMLGIADCLVSTRYSEAVYWYEKLLKTEPSVSAALGLSNLYIKREQFEKARKWLLYTLEIHPNHFLALSALERLPET